MNYQTPESRRQPIEETLEALRSAQRVILSTHINADGDGAGSQVALGAWLRGQGKEAWIINPTPFPKAMTSLLSSRDWILDAGSPAAREVAAKADLAVVVDTGEVPRIGSVMDLIRDLPAVVIDHHPPGPEPIPGISFRDPAACAAGELVFDLLMAAGEPLTHEAARGLYVAVLSDTGSFRFANTTPSAHRIAAVLLEAGADPEELHRMAYGNVPLRKLRLLRAALEHLEVDPEGGVAWMTVPTESYDELGANADDIEGLVNYPREIEGIEVGLLFRETAKGATKVSFRSNGQVDVNALARHFGGGGHVRASGAVVHRPLSEVREEVLEMVRSTLRGRSGDGGA